jgi:peptidoglycan hydrolase CwlO-like protein
MKKTLSIIIIIALSLLAVWYIFIHSPAKFDTKPYDVKIDSLQHNIDSLAVENIQLEAAIEVLEDDNDYLVDKVVNLNNKVVYLKDDLKDAKNALKYTPTQVDSFFIAKYPNEYVLVSQDTTQLPLEVSKAVVVDIKEGETNKSIVVAQDSIIMTLDEVVKNREEVISLLRDKEATYILIDKDKSGQIDNYKMQVTGLKTDIKKTEKRLKINRFQKLALGAAIIGLLIVK